MKKSVLVLIVGVFMMSACSSYTCPTYTKAPVDDVETLEEEKV